MKSICLFLASCFISFSSIGQVQYVVKFKSSLIENYFYPNIDLIKCETKGNSIQKTGKGFLYIIGDTNCTNIRSRWYVLLIDKGFVFAEKYYFDDNSTKIDSLLNIIKQKNPDIEKRAKFAPNEISRIGNEEKKRLEEEDRPTKLAAIEQEKKEKRELDSLSKLIDKGLTTFRSKNYVLWNWSWSYPNEYSSSVDVNITIINPY